MKRVALALILAMALEYWAFQIYRTHPLVRPPHFKTLLLFIQMSMCWAGVEAARWMLRHSPVSRLEGGVESDWVKLWLWLGPPGGLLLTLACFLGKWAYLASESRWAGPIVVAHASGGALAWLIAGFWALPAALTDSSMNRTERILALLGLATNTLGFWSYMTVYPAKTLPFMAILASGLFFFYLLYFVGMACLGWAVVFRFWRPDKAS